MRLRLETFALCMFMAGTVIAAPPTSKKTKAKATTSTVLPLPSSKADPAVAGRALLVKDLPNGLSIGDRASIDGVVTELRADHLEAAAAAYRGWAMTGTKPLAGREDMVNTALWAFREGILSRSAELGNAGDRIRFFDERNAAVDDSLALLRGAVITKKPVLVAKLVVLSPYVKEMRGDNKAERQITRDALDGEIRSLDTKGEEIKVERDKLRAAFTTMTMDAKTSQYMQLLYAIVSAANDAKIAAVTNAPPKK